MRRLRILLIAILAISIGAVFAASPVFYYSRLRTSSGAALRWKTLPVKFTINDQGCDNIPDASDDAAIRLGFQTWQDVAGSNVSFLEDTNPTQKARTDFDSDSIHLMYFDETGGSGYFGGGGSGIIAITPVSFFTSPSASDGVIADADIIFNGRDFVFSTNLSPATIDLQSVAAHEIGHLIGFDHEAFGGATMYPFNGTQQFNQRTVSSDETAAAEIAYPSVTKGKITGTVKRSSNGSVVKGAHVWARAITDGRNASAAYTADDGTFTITGLAAGDYRIGIEALEGPVSAANLGANTVGTVETNFQAGQSGVITVAGTATTAAGDITVGASPLYNLTSPTRSTQIHPSEVKVIHFAGSLPLVANTDVTMPDTGSVFTLGYAAGNNLTITAGSGALPGLYDIMLRDTTNDQRILYSGFIEVLPAAPTVGNAAPQAGATAGGTAVTINGTNYTGTPIVLFGDVPGTNVNVVSPTQLTVTSPAHAAGNVDIVVQTSGGEEARLTNGFSFGDATQPSLVSIFPANGSTTGGGAIALTGTNFVNGLSVKFDSTLASSVTFVSSTELIVITPALAAGTHDVTVINPGALQLSSTLAGAYTAVASAAPIVSSSNKPNVSFFGGETVTLNGSNFQGGAVLKLFSNIINGSGGVVVPTTSITPTQIQFVTPAGGVGDASIWVQNPDGLSFVGNGLLEYQYSVNTTGTLKGNINNASDTDIIYLETVAGAKITVTAAQSASTLKPKIVIKDSAGTVLISTDSNDAQFNASFASAAANGKSAAVKNFIVNTTERFQIVISGLSSTSGKYKCTVKETLPANAKSIKANKLAVGPGDSALPFVAKRGSALKGKFSAKKPLQILLSAFTAPSGSILGDSDVTSKIVTAAGNVSLQFNSTPLKEFGSYLLTVGPNAATTGTFSGTLTIVPPKTATAATEN